MGTDKCLHIGEVLAQGPDGPVVRTGGVQGYGGGAGSLGADFVEDLAGTG